MKENQTSADKLTNKATKTKKIHLALYNRCQFTYVYMLV